MGAYNSGNLENDVRTAIDIEETNVSSSLFVLEAVQTGGQAQWVEGWWDGVPGFTESTAQQVEYYSSQSAGTDYLIGGEVYETYTASASQTTKTKTVSYPIGVVTNGSIAVEAETSTNVYFPESGVVIKSAWFRIIVGGFQADTAQTILVSSGVGSNAELASITYSFNDTAADSIMVESFKMIHVIASNQYTELDDATATTPKTVRLHVKPSINTIRGISAELMITYTYTAETNGYLVPLQVFAGQESSVPDQTETITNAAEAILPETSGTKTIRQAALMAAYAVQDTDNTHPGGPGNVDANMSTGTPTCSNAFDGDLDSANGFMQYYKGVTSAMNTTNAQNYTACYTNDGFGDVGTGAAKKNGYLIYTYQLDQFVISGTCKKYDQTTPCDICASCIKAAVNGSLDTATGSIDASGNWSIGLAGSSPTSGQVVAVFKNNVEDPAEAVAVTKYDGSGGNITGMLLYEMHLTIGSGDLQTLSNNDLSVYDSSVSTDEDVFFESDGTNLVACQLAGCESAEIYIVAGNTYQPRSAGSSYVKAHDIEIDGTFDMTGASNYASISGSWDNDNIFTANSSTIFFTASDSTEIVSASAGSTNSFYNLTLGESATSSVTGHWDSAGNIGTLTVTGTLYPLAGTLHMNGADNVSLGNNFYTGSSGYYTKSTGTFTFNKNGTAQWGDYAGVKSDLGAVAINGGGSATTVNLLTSAKATSMNITSSDTFDLGSSAYTLTITGSGQAGSRPLIDGGTLDCGSNSTVEFTGTAATDIDTTGYYNLTLNGTGTYYSYGNTVASGSLSVAAGTFDGQDDTWTLYKTGTGVFSVAGTFTPSTSTINYAGDGASTVASMSDGGNTGYYNLQIGNATTQTSGQTYTLDGAVTATNNLTLGPSSGSNTQTFDVSASNYGITVYVDFTVNSMASLSARSGTITLGGSTASTTLTDSSTNKFEPYNLTINKTSGTDANDNIALTNNLTVRNTLTITDGELVQGNYNITSQGSSAVSVASAGKWNNVGTGDLTLGGTFANSGTVIFNTSNNGCTGGGIADGIAITSTAGGTQRNWTSTSPIQMFNVSVTDMTSSADIIAYSSTFSNVGPKWALAKCSDYSTPYNRIEGSTRIKGGTRIK